MSDRLTRVVIHDLGPAAVAAMPRYDLSSISEEPPGPFPPFAFHGCAGGIASTVGAGPWELHTAGDELLHLLDGELSITVREQSGEATYHLAAGDLMIVPAGCWHRSWSDSGVTFLFLTPAEGNRHAFGDPA